MGSLRTEETAPGESKKPVLDWSDVVAKFNIAPEFAKNLEKTALKNHNVIGMRLDGRDDQVVERPCAAKPMYVKFNTDNWGMMKGFVPVDQAILARSVGKKVKPGAATDETRDADLEQRELAKYSRIIGIGTQKITLQEIIALIHSGDLEQRLDNPDPSKILLTPVGKNAPKDTEVVFRINLANPQPLTKGAKFVEDKMPAKATLQMPGKWDFSEAKEYEYVAEYRPQAHKEFKELQVYGTPLDGEFYPFSKDNDGLLATVAKDQFDDLPPEATQIIDTMAKGEAGRGMQEKLIQGLYTLLEYFWKKEHLVETVPDTVKEELLAKVYKSNSAYFGTGMVYDLYLKSDLNEGIKKDPFNYMQHGFENYNPSKVPSDINSDVLWVNKDGQPVITHNIKEHSNFLLTLCDTQVFFVNPNWNMQMDLFGQVVQKQLQLGMPVWPETVKNWSAEVKKQLELDAPLSIDTLVVFIKNNKELDVSTLNKCVDVVHLLGAKANGLRDELYTYFKNMCERQSSIEKGFRDSMAPFSALKASEARGIPKDQVGVKSVEDAYKNLVESVLNKTKSPPVAEPVGSYKSSRSLR